MKGILRLLRRPAHSKSLQDQEPSDSVFFSTAFAEQDAGAAALTPWEARAAEVGAQRLSPSHGGKLLQALWAQDKHMALLGQNAIARLVQFLQFAQVAAQRDVIRQGEYGNFMVVLLSGAIAVDRTQPSGEPWRLTQTRPGDILGEMSLLDSGVRFSSCTTLSDCDIAVLSADAMDDMMANDAPLAASLVALLSRKLSLRLRAVSTRLSECQP